MDVENRIIDYVVGNEARLGFVVRRNKNKLQVQSEAGRSERVADRQVIAVYECLAGEVDPKARFRAANEALSGALDELDVELLWQELLGNCGRAHSPAEMSRVYFGDTAPAHLSAIVRAVAADPVHFKRQGLDFLPRTEVEAAEITELRRKRAVRAALREAALNWAREVCAHRGDETLPVPPEFADFVRRTHDFLMAGHNSEAVQLLTEVRKAKTSREAALDILKKTGRLPRDADPFLLLNGIHAGFSRAVLAHAESLSLEFGSDEREDHTRLVGFSIDDAETREIDDAISVQVAEDEVLVQLHIADPAHLVEKGDILDRAAAERPLSLYLPTTTVMMFPERVGCDLASLRAGESRAALSFSIRFSAAGELRDWRIGSSRVQLQHRLTYDEADAMLEPADPHPLAGRLRALRAVTDRLRREREANGAFSLNRPELKVRVEGERIAIKRIDPLSPSRQIVGELMILVNRLAAEHALSHDIPVIYRVQDPPSGPVEAMDGYDPAHFLNQVKKLKRTRLSTHPQPHAGLGLDVYVQVSSPLRRFADLVLLRQLDAQLRGVALPYEQQELLEVLGTVERTSMQNRALERDASSQWVLEFLRRERSACKMGATVVQKRAGRVFAELDDFCERGLLAVKGTVKVGQRLEVRIAEVRPEAGQLVLEPV